ncbi:MAG: bifunctional phosphopantothenoylcysteine decarboxylase/phosphopantothenate--cysteine ligase CoaBC [Opitutaceae bacterium]|nr:bifunctional phosphopantothenoylcysteine decarboxylase/phosphopantothenate--cysteine ligase CoaBC [Opitutaceae bacterium]
MCAAKILFELTGSIAAWKACAVISRLVQDGHEVQTIATAAALQFIGPATLEGLTGRRVRSDMWDRGTAMDHINLVKWADVVVVCPATANTINKLAAGLADDLVGALFLAHDWKKPFLLAPAMNPAMWAHPATRAGVEKLRGWGVKILPVARGRLACGDEGEGRMIEPEEILAAIRESLAPSAVGRVTPRGASVDVAGSVTRPTAKPHRRVLVTAGGTEEPIDGVRTLTNFSTGRTGALLAEHLRAWGCDVTLLRAHRATPPPAGVRGETFVTFADLRGALERLLGGEHFDAVVHAAAVSDYAVAGLRVNGQPLPPGAGKLGTEQKIAIELAPNPKLVDHLRAWSRNPELRVIAFKLTREADAAAARAAVEKLFAHSRADAVVHNDLAAVDAATGRFPATLWRADGTSTALESREALAHAIATLIADNERGGAGAPPSTLTRERRSQEGPAPAGPCAPDEARDPRAEHSPNH